jgi:hypothetical protein
MNPTAPGSNQNTVCSNICMQNSDCPIYSQQVLIGYGTCYTDIGRCATPPIEGGCGTGPVGTPLTCQNYEICEDRGNGPKCYERTPPNACAPPNGIP